MWVLTNSGSRTALRVPIMVSIKCSKGRSSGEIGLGALLHFVFGSVRMKVCAKKLQAEVISLDLRFMLTKP